MKLLCIVFLLSVNALGQNKWDRLNGPVGGTIQTVLSFSDTIVVSATPGSMTDGSVYFSTNNGTDWVRSYGKFSDAFIGFEQTKDKGFLAISFLGKIYKSYDLINWKSLYTFYNERFRSHGRDSSGNIYLGTEGGTIYMSTNNGKFWLTMFVDANAIWKIANVGNEIYANNGFRIIKRNPLSWDTLPYIGQNYLPFSVNSELFAFGPGTIAKYKESVWTKINTDFFSGEYIYDLLFNKNLIAGCNDETSYFGDGWGIAVSEDTGVTWKWNNNGLPPKFHAALSLAISGHNTYLGTSAAGVFKSSDFGSSWFPVNNGLTAANCLDVEFDKDSVLYTASWSNGLQKSSDFGKTWSVINNGLTNSYCYSIASDYNGGLIAGTEQGTFRSYNNGDNWEKINNWFSYFLFTDSQKKIYSSRLSMGMYRTTDLGNTWTKFDNGFDDGYVLGFAEDSSHNIYTSTPTSIYKTTDDGLTWTKVHQSSSDYYIQSLAISPSGSIFASVKFQGIIRSTDNGSTWQLVKSDIGNKGRCSIAINSKGEIFAGLSTADNYYLSENGKKFYSSNNNGDDWSDITSNLLMTEVQDIYIDKNDNMYLATDESVWRNNPDYPVNVKEEIKHEFNYSLEQNYPNPFNPSTSIKYFIKQREFVTLDIYDVLGNKITSLLNEEKDAGVYEVNWNASKFSSGVYFYKLKAGGFIETRKMILIK
ncbi:MAG: T9SS type A sorting domain-containing protein, partial [Methanococcaceae archaeon]